jgi:D-ribose pyranase
MYSEIQKRLPNIPIETMPHLEFKKLTASTKAVIRTADFTPYSNVILVAGAWGFKL